MKHKRLTTIIALVAVIAFGSNAGANAAFADSDGAESSLDSGIVHYSQGGVGA